jgi:integrase
MATTETLLRANRKRRVREQKGTLVERRDGFYLRYYIDGQDGTRRKVSEWLCDLDTKKKLIEIKLKQRIFEINTQAENGVTAEAVVVDQTIADFWEKNYIPWCEANLAKSTVRGYKKLWAVLEPRVGSRSLQKFRRVEASDFLTSLVKDGWNNNSMKHAKFLLSGLYSRAVSRDIVPANPMTDAKSDVPAPPPKERIAYTDAEVVAVLHALDRPDAKLLWALCSILGMRPSEAAGLLWECCSGDRIRIERAAPDGVMQEFTKSDRGKRQLLLIEPVRSLLNAWKAACSDPATGLVFDNGEGQPIDHSVFVGHWIAPGAKKACSRWSGLYSGRHATLTGLAIQTGDAGASHQVGGNSREVAERNYVHPVQEAGDAGLRLREAALATLIQR